ncbi:MAG TPA: hypothetical protein VIM51_13640 [Desulfosporosinus sp.]
MPKLVICHHHNQIKTKATELLKIERWDYSNIESLLADVRSIASDIYEASILAFSAGRSMENRLKVYKKAIEGLGFERRRFNDNHSPEP